MKTILRVGLLLTLTVFLVAPLRGFKFTGSRWATPATTMYVSIGAPWDDSFKSAMGFWSQSTPFQFSSVSEFFDPCSNPNNTPPRNGLKFSDTICGDAFGSSTLAIALTWSQSGATSQSGVIFNSVWKWAVYDGPYSSGAFQGIQDFQRVAVHELGHVLGLDHEDSVPAIMTTAQSFGNTLTSPTPDDIAGVVSRYGGSGGGSDTTGPSLQITSHSSGQAVSTNSITLSGTASDAGRGDNGVSSVSVNGVRAGGDTATGATVANWSRIVPLNPGANTITVIARDNSPAQNPTTVTLTITSSFAPTSGTFHVFPQFADGRLGDGTYYRTTLMISNPSSTAGPVCTLALRGFTVPGFSLSYTLAPSGWVIAPTAGTQSFQSGYATLTCTASVEAQLLYSFYSPNGVKVSEATVFSSPSANITSVFSDTRENARVGLAIANDTDQSTTYTISSNVTTATGTVTLAPRTATARFVDQFISGFPSNTTGTVRVSSAAGTASIIGLRYTGGVFTTLPESQRSSVGPTASIYHVFPQFADGRLVDGTYYRTTRMYINTNTGSTADCTTRLRGLTVDGNNSFILSLPPNTFFISSTPGTQPYQGGYATLECTASVEAQALYSFYNASGVKLAEATVFSSPSASTAQILADSREGSRVGLAIANDSSQTHTYTITVANSTGAVIGTATQTLGPRTNIAKFVDEFVTLPPNHFGQVIVSSTTGTASIIGLRFTGASFTTIPATIRN